MPGPGMTMTKAIKIPQSKVTFAEYSRESEDLINLSSKNGAEGKVTEMLPGKSSLSRIILHDNVSQKRLLDMKLSVINNQERRNDSLFNHYKKTFITRLERKQKTWIKEDNYVRKNLSFPALATSYSAWEGGESPRKKLFDSSSYPYNELSVTVRRLHTQPAPQIQTDREELPRLATVPIQTKRHSYGSRPPKSHRGDDSPRDNSKQNLPKLPTIKSTETLRGVAMPTGEGTKTSRQNGWVGKKLTDKGASKNAFLQDDRFARLAALLQPVKNFPRLAVIRESERGGKDSSSGSSIVDSDYSLTGSQKVLHQAVKHY
ncbi:uncharacterized protein LOC118429676 [Branchiostoma floridae]|uniref:Uncharacterized protein LOC118429676 n=2 Tax=Branchiostoma floridae TaxID=7739 RepID=A0A9J7M7H9_BRAFL|nr:uncharacterized protein LOC118429676 [Branchiostoma floridae]